MNITRATDAIKEQFEVDTNAFEIGEDSRNQYTFNFGYASGQFSALAMVSESFSEWSYVMKAREYCDGLFANAERIEYDI